MTGEQRGRNQQGEPDQLDTPAFFLAHPHPTRNDRKAVFPVFVSCFRFFRRGGMFHDCSVSAAVTHLVSCGGGYAGLPDTCMRASLTAAVSWLACLVRCPDICTLPSSTELAHPGRSRVVRKGKFDIMRKSWKSGQAHHPIQRAHRIISIIIFMFVY